MNMILKRIQERSDGIFSDFLTEKQEKIGVNLEHAFLVNGLWKPKVAPGIYICVRGLHRLESMTTDFETFQIMGVPLFLDHPVTKILFHWGNWDINSEGCSLTGESIAPSARGQMVTNSRAAFAKFMRIQTNVASFQLTVDA